MKAGQKISKSVEKVFFYIKTPQQQYKVIGTLQSPLTQSIGSRTPPFYCQYIL